MKLKKKRKENSRIFKKCPASLDSFIGNWAIGSEL
jgi:hypothetical protein